MPARGRRRDKGSSRNKKKKQARHRHQQQSNKKNDAANGKSGAGGGVGDANMLQQDHGRFLCPELIGPVQSAGLGLHLLFPTQSTSTEARSGSLAAANYAQGHRIARNVVTDCTLLLGELGDFLKPCDIDLSVKVADIDACLQKYFGDYRQYTLLRYWTQFLVGDVHMPRLSRLIAVTRDECSLIMEEDESLLLNDACVFKIEEEHSPNARIFVPLSPRSLAKVDDRNKSVEMLLNTSVDFAFSAGAFDFLNDANGSAASGLPESSTAAPQDMEGLKTVVHVVVTKQLKIRKEVEMVNNMLQTLQQHSFDFSGTSNSGKQSVANEEESRIARHPTLSGTVSMTARRIESWLSDLSRLVDCMKEAALSCYQLSNTTKDILDKFLALQLSYLDACREVDSLRKERRIKEYDARVRLNSAIDPVHSGDDLSASAVDISSSNSVEYVKGLKVKLLHENNKSVLTILQQPAHVALRLFPELQTLVFRTATHHDSAQDFLSFQRRGSGSTRAITSGATSTPVEKALFAQIEEDWRACAALRVAFEDAMSKGVATLLQQPQFNTGELGFRSRSIKEQDTPDTSSAATIKSAQRCVDTWRSHVDALKLKVKLWSDAQISSLIVNYRNGKGGVAHDNVISVKGHKTLSSSNASNESSSSTQMQSEWTSFDSAWKAKVIEEEYALKQGGRADDKRAAILAKGLQKLRKKSQLSAFEQRMATAQGSKLHILQGFKKICALRRQVKLIAQLQNRLKVYYYSVQNRVRAVCDSRDTSDATLSQVCVSMLISKVRGRWREARANFVREELERNEQRKQDETRLKQLAAEEQRLARVERERERKKKIQARKEAPPTKSSSTATGPEPPVPLKPVQPNQPIQRAVIGNQCSHAHSVESALTGAHGSHTDVSATTESVEKASVLVASLPEAMDGSDAQGGDKVPAAAKQIPSQSTNGQQKVAVVTTTPSSAEQQSIYNLSPRRLAATPKSVKPSTSAPTTKTDAQGSNEPVEPSESGQISIRSAGATKLEGIPAPVTAVHHHSFENSMSGKSVDSPGGDSGAPQNMPHMYARDIYATSFERQAHLAMMQNRMHQSAAQMHTVHNQHMPLHHPGFHRPPLPSHRHMQHGGIATQPHVIGTHHLQPSGALPPMHPTNVTFHPTHSAQQQQQQQQHHQQQHMMMMMMMQQQPYYPVDMRMYQQQQAAAAREAHMASFVVILAQSLYHLALVRRRFLASKLLDVVQQESSVTPSERHSTARQQRRPWPNVPAEALLSAFLKAFVMQSRDRSSNSGGGGSDRASQIVTNFQIRQPLVEGFLRACQPSSTVGACHEFVHALFAGWTLKSQRLVQENSESIPVTNEIQRTFLCPFLKSAAGFISDPSKVSSPPFMLELNAADLTKYFESHFASVSSGPGCGWEQVPLARKRDVWSQAVCTLHQPITGAEPRCDGGRSEVHWTRKQMNEYLRQTANSGRSKAGHLFCVGLNWPSTMAQREIIDPLHHVLAAAEILQSPRPENGSAEKPGTADIPDMETAPKCQLQCVVSQVSGEIVSFCRSSILKVWIRVNARGRVELVGPGWQDVHRNLKYLHACPLLLFYHVGN